MRRINTVAKGDRHEVEAMRCYEEMGYSVHRVRKTRIFKGDMFGCADLLAMNEWVAILVAVTDFNHAYRARKKLSEFTNHPPNIIKVICLYKNGVRKTEVVD